jgi:1-acyl-sn-glycerol-3-phosphate acyltransferase
MQLLPARCPKTDFMRMLIRLLASYLFRVRLVGDLAPLLQAPRVLVVANHGSWLDTLLLGLLLPRQPVVVVPPDDARTPWRRRWLGLVSTTVVDVNNPVVIKRVLRLLKSGRPVVMYPEGRTNPGHGVLKVYPVPALVALKSGATILPVHLDWRRPPLAGLLPPQATVRVQAPSGRRCGAAPTQRSGWPPSCKRWNCRPVPERRFSNASSTRSRCMDGPGR